MLRLVTPRPLLLLATLVLSLASCSKPGAPPNPSILSRHVGEECVIEYRRDALGAGAALPIGPEVDETNGSQVCTHGKLTDVEREGIVVERAISQTTTTFTFWIPFHAILNVRFQREK